MLRTLGIVATATLFASASQAAIIAIDDFSTPSIAVIDPQDDGIPVTSGPQAIVVNGNALTRTITVNLLSAVPPQDAKAQALDGLFDIALGSQDDAVVTLTYNVDALQGDFATYQSISSLSLLVEILGADGTNKSLNAIMNGDDLGTFSLPDQVTSANPRTLRFDLSPNTDVNGNLEFRFNGNPGYDLSFALIGFEVFGDLEQTPIPEPGVLGLLGLGVLGVAAAGGRRRR